MLKTMVRSIIEFLLSSAKDVIADQIWANILKPLNICRISLAQNAHVLFLEG